MNRCQTASIFSTQRCSNEPSASISSINTFTVEAANAERLLQALSEATETLFRHQPGFASANLHMSRDHRRIVNYPQWRSKENYAAMSKGT
jgi:quinol monooxygenase YgiN